MTVNMLIQIDKLVQLLESPVFTCKTIHHPPTIDPSLTHPNRSPPPTSRTRKISLPLQMPLRRAHAPPAKLGLRRAEKPSKQRQQHRVSPRWTAQVCIRKCRHPSLRPGLNHSYSSSTAQTGPGPGTNFDRVSGSRLKRDESHPIKWTELLDKFKSVQERARRTQASQRHSLDPSDTLQNPSLSAALSAATTDRTRDRAGLPDVPRGGLVSPGGGVGLGVSGSTGVGGSAGRGLLDPKAGTSSSLLGSSSKNKSSLPNLGRLGIGGRKSKR